MAHRFFHILTFLFLTANHAIGQDVVSQDENQTATGPKHDIFGSKRLPIGENSHIVFSGLDKSTFYFHPVTGAGLEECISLYKDKPSSVWEIGGKMGYAFSADRLTAELNAQLFTNRQYVCISVGRDFCDWKGDIGEERFNNSLIALFSKKNYKKLNWCKYANFEYSIRPAFGLELSTGLKAEDIESENNRCNFSIFRYKKRFKPNEPYNSLIKPEMDWEYRQTAVWIEANYTPLTVGFTDDNGRRFELGSLWPTFGIRIEQGVGPHSTYTHANVNANQRIALQNDAMLKWEIEAGKFFGNDLIGFGQWKHFRGSNKRFALSNELDGYIGFVMFRPYELSTNKWYASTRVAYITPKLLLKQINAISLWPFKEELYFKNAIINGNTSYTEIGYGLGRVLDMLRLTVFTSFKNTSFDEIKFRMAIDL